MMKAPLRLTLLRLHRPVLSSPFGNSSGALVVRIDDDDHGGEHTVFNPQ